MKKEDPAKDVIFDPRVGRGRNIKTGRLVSIKDVIDKSKPEVKEEAIGKKEEKKVEELELKVLQLSNLSKNVLSAFISIDKKTSLFEKRISELESKLKSQTKEKKPEKQSTVLIKIKDDLVKINSSFGSIIQLLSDKPIISKQRLVYENNAEKTSEKKTSEFSWLKLLGFGLFAAAPYLIGLVRNLDPNKIKKTLNNVYDFLTKRIPKFFMEDLPSFFSGDWFGKIKNSLSDISLLDAAALYILLSTFKGTIFSLLWKGLKKILSLPFKAIGASVKGVGSLLKFVPDLFKKIRIFTLALAAGYIGYELGKKIADIFTNTIENSKIKSNEYQDNKAKKFSERVTTATSKLKETGSLSKYGINEEQFTDYISQMPPGELEKIEKRISAITESTDENIKSNQEKQLFENTDETDSIGGSLNIAGRITGVMDPKPINPSHRKIKTNTNTNEQNKQETNEPLNIKIHHNNGKSVSPEINVSPPKPANLMESSAEETTDNLLPLNDATKEPSEGQSSKPTNEYQTIAGQQVVPGQALTEEQRAVMQIKKEMSGSAKPSSSIQPSNKIDGKELKQMSQDASRSKSKNIVINSNEQNKAPRTMKRRAQSPDKEFLNVDEVPDPTVVFNNLEDQLFFSAA